MNSFINNHGKRVRQNSFKLFVYFFFWKNHVVVNENIEKILQLQMKSESPMLKEEQKRTKKIILSFQTNT